MLSERYRIDQFIARGGMGEVYCAFDLELEIPVAVKTIRSEIANDSRAIRRLKQEVLIARSISHPNVCRIYDLGRDPTTGVWFLTMEYLPGETLLSRIRSTGPMAPDRALQIVKQITEALDAAHRAGIVHRDFKSANVMLIPTKDGDQAVVTDFGLAIVAEESSAPSGGASEMRRSFSSQDGSGWSFSLEGIRGTPAYMSPEQVIGDKIDFATDLYALGIVIFEMVTARLPFDGATPLELAHARLTTDPLAPSRVVAVDPEWERVILKLLSKESKQRYLSGRDVLLALEGRHLEIRSATFNLPAERDAFVGRSIELTRLTHQLESGRTEPVSAVSIVKSEDGVAATHPGTTDESSIVPGVPNHSRLLSIVGTAGTGKTRLAIQYGWQSLSRWPGGVWFCDLSEARTLDEVVRVVATSLDVPLGKDDPVTQVGHAIAGFGPALVVLDNVEHVAEHADATIGKWLLRCTKARFLITSRERLHVEGEDTLTLEPLDPTIEGAYLFVLRAQEHRPGFRVDESTEKVVQEIVAQLDGLPLAIELAAARLRVLNLSQLRDRLENRFQLLTSHKRGRHSTLRAAIDWSWDILAAWEKQALVQTSVFSGGFTMEAAEAVVDVSNYPEAPPVFDVVQSLLDKSWLRAEVRAESLRFQMYTIIQAYVVDIRQDMTTSGHSSAVVSLEGRHGQYFSSMGTMEVIEALDRHGGHWKRLELGAEIENLVSACRRAIAAGNETVASQAYVAVAAVIDLQGPFGLSLKLGTDALQTVRTPSLLAPVLCALAKAERRVGSFDSARIHYETSATTCRQMGDTRGEATCLHELGKLYSEQGRDDQGIELFERSLAMHRQVSNQRGEGVALVYRGVSRYNQGKVEEAQRDFEDSLTIHRQGGDLRMEGMALDGLGFCQNWRGRCHDARKSHEAALALHRQVGDRLSEGIVLGHLGTLCQQEGRIAEARWYFEEALAIHRKIGNRRAEGDSTFHLATLDHWEGEVDKVEAGLRLALSIHSETRNYRPLIIVLRFLGRYYLGRGQVDDSLACTEQAMSVARELGDQREQGILLLQLAQLDLDLDRVAAARAHLQEALLIHRRIGDRLLEGFCHQNLGSLEYDDGCFEKARAHFETALALHHDVGNRRAEGSSLLKVGKCCRSQGETQVARSHLEAALTIHREIGDRIFEGFSLSELGILYRETGEFKEAESYFNNAVEVLRSCGRAATLISVLCERGQFKLEVGRSDAAVEALLEAEAIVRKLGLGQKSEGSIAIDALRAALGVRLPSG